MPTHPGCWACLQDTAPCATPGGQLAPGTCQLLAPPGFNLSLRLPTYVAHDGSTGTSAGFPLRLPRMAYFPAFLTTPGLGSTFTFNLTCPGSRIPGACALADPFAAAFLCSTLEDCEGVTVYSQGEGTGGRSGPRVRGQGWRAGGAPQVWGVLGGRRAASLAVPWWGRRAAPGGGSWQRQRLRRAMHTQHSAPHSGAVPSRGGGGSNAADQQLRQRCHCSQPHPGPGAPILSCPPAPTRLQALAATPPPWRCCVRKV